jgi:hypothetical protein
MTKSNYITRYIEASVTDDLSRKMVFIGGPRQAGKTTLAKHLCQLAGCDISNRYLNWDATEDRENIIKESFPAGPGRITPFFKRIERGFAGIASVYLCSIRHV